MEPRAQLKKIKEQQYAIKVNKQEVDKRKFKDHHYERDVYIV